MTTTAIVSEPAPTVQPLPPGAYIVAEDYAPEWDGHTLRGVIVREDGPVAARLRCDGLGEYLESAYDADDLPVLPLAGWEGGIKRQLGAVAWNSAAA